GYDISRLKARRISGEDFERFDFVVALDGEHMRLMRRSCPPELQHKLYELMAFAPDANHREVPDPYYGPADGFELVLDLLEEAIEGLLKEIPSSPWSSLGQAQLVLARDAQEIELAFGRNAHDIALVLKELLGVDERRLAVLSGREREGWREVRAVQGLAIHD